MEKDLNAWLKAAADGDTAAANALWVRCFETMLDAATRRARSSGLSTGWATQAINSAFQASLQRKRAAKSDPDFLKDGEEFLAYVYVATRNKLHRYAKQEWKIRKNSQQLLASEPELQANATSEIAEKCERKLADLVEELCGNDDELGKMVLGMSQQKSPQEIANELGFAVATYYRRFDLLKKRARRILDNEDAGG